MNNLLDTIQRPLDTQPYAIQISYAPGISDEHKRHLWESARRDAGVALYELVAPLRPGIKGTIFAVQVIEEELVPKFGRPYSHDPYIENWDVGGLGIRFEITPVQHKKMEVVSSEDIYWEKVTRKTFLEKLKWLLKRD